MNRISSYPERIVPHQTTGGPLASHLKRYDFASHFTKDRIVLDVACGMGYGTFFLSDFARTVDGVDISSESIAYAKSHYKKSNIEFYVMDACKLKFPDQSYDIVCSFETLEHLDYPEEFLKEVKRVIKKTGVFIVSTPHARKTTYKPSNPFHKFELSYTDFESFLKKYFARVEIFGERRKQSNFHYYLQKLDIFHFRAMLPGILRKKVCNAVGTRSWDEADNSDIIIDKKMMPRSTELIAVCSF
ncbi:MAG: class I SAM-dependent methyltransferase [Candidatus Omnitrophica bacterium]|nr:class I SAM-dependent methyltransferase [Candidatus Omnitrophota bacterium]